MAAISWRQRRKDMKKLAMKVAVAAAVLAIAALCGAQDIQVEVNGTALVFSGAQPQYVDGRVLVPMRRIFEQLGAKVNWDQGERKVWAMKGPSEVELWIGDRQAIVNGSRVTLDVPAMVIDGTTMVPIRFVSESLGAQVGWLESQQLVSIDTTTTSVVAESKQELRSVLVPAAEVIPATMDRRISSVYSTAGDRFTATISTARMPDDINLPDGAQIEGHIGAVRSTASGRRAMLDFAIDRLVLPNGRTVPLDAIVVTVSNPGLTRGDDGTFYSGLNFTIPAGARIEVRTRHAVRRL